MLKSSSASIKDNSNSKCDHYNSLGTQEVKGTGELAYYKGKLKKINSEILRDNDIILFLMNVKQSHLRLS